jgi:hypothetical protein
MAMGTAGATVAFICMASAHLQKNGALVDHLTIHEKTWAYCPMNVRIDGHDWKATGGVSMGDLEVLVRGMRERAGVNGDSHTKDR